MGVGRRIKEMREKLGLKQSDLAKKIGVTPSAIGNYENEISHPKVDVLYKLFEALDCDANYLFQDMFEEKKDKLLTIAEISLIDKYRILNPHGKKTVDIVLNIEYENSLKEQNKNSSEDTITLPIAARGGKAKPVALSRKEYEEANKKHKDLFEDDDTPIIPLDED